MLIKPRTTFEEQNEIFPVQVAEPKEKTAVVWFVLVAVYSKAIASWPEPILSLSCTTTQKWLLSTLRAGKKAEGFR